MLWSNHGKIGIRDGDGDGAVEECGGRGEVNLFKTKGDSFCCAVHEGQWQRDIKMHNKDKLDQTLSGTILIIESKH